MGRGEGEGGRGEGRGEREREREREEGEKGGIVEDRRLCMERTKCREGRG